MNSSKQELQYLFIKSNHSPSLDIADSDHIGNLLYMQHLVGTLVKYQSSGRYLPSLAEHWEVSDDRRSWKFTLREGIVCEDGAKITGEGFRRSLLRSLKMYSDKKSPPVFDKLVGWSQFIDSNGESLAGLRSENENTLSFSFINPVQGGLLEFLGMPYFGYICEGNFQNGKWKDSNKILSSGPYRLDSVLNGNNAVLKKRPEWFRFAKNSPDTVLIKNIDSYSAIPENAEKTIFDTLPKPEDTIPANFTQVREIPTTFLPIILLPHHGSAFESKEVREVLRKKLLQNKSKISFESPSYQLGDSFYPSHPTSHRSVGELEEKTLGSKIKKKLLIRSYAKPLGRNLLYIESLLQKTLVEAGVDFEFDNSPVTKVSDWFNPKYDIRILGADIGGGIENWVIRMMFCSDLGVRFPDVKGRICRLVEEFDTGKVDFEKYVDEFNRIIFEDSVIVPVMHGGRSWYLSKDIPLKGLSPVLGLPRFEDLSLE